MVDDEDALLLTVAIRRNHGSERVYRAIDVDVVKVVAWPSRRARASARAKLRIFVTHRMARHGASGPCHRSQAGVCRGAPFQVILATGDRVKIGLPEVGVVLITEILAHLGDTASCSVYT